MDFDSEIELRICQHGDATPIDLSSGGLRSVRNLCSLSCIYVARYKLAFAVAKMFATMNSPFASVASIIQS